MRGRAGGPSSRWRAIPTSAAHFPMAHQPLAAILGLLISVAAEEGCDLSLDGLRQQRTRALAQNFGERVRELCWLDQLDDIILGHGVSLLWWRSGGWNTPTIRRLIPS